MRLEEGHSGKGNSMSKNREAGSHRKRSDRKRSSGERVQERQGMKQKQNIRCIDLKILVNISVEVSVQ